MALVRAGVDIQRPSGSGGGGGAAVVGAAELAEVDGAPAGEERLRGLGRRRRDQLVPLQLQRRLDGLQRARPAPGDDQPKSRQQDRLAPSHDHGKPLLMF